MCRMTGRERRYVTSMVGRVLIQCCQALGPDTGAERLYVDWPPEEKRLAAALVDGMARSDALQQFAVDAMAAEAAPTGPPLSQEEAEAQAKTMDEFRYSPGSRKP